MNVDDITKRVDELVERFEAMKGRPYPQAWIADLKALCTVVHTAVEALDEVQREHPAEPEKMILGASNALASIHETLGIKEKRDG